MRLSEAIKGLRWDIGGVYLIRCVDGRQYIGGTRSIRGRLNQHRYKLQRDIHKNPLLQEAWNRLGPASFTADLVTRIDDPNQESIHAEENLCLRIARRDGIDLFNINPLAESRAGAKLSEEQRRHIGSVQIGRKASAETRRKMSLAHLGNQNGKGYRHTEAARLKIAQARLANPLSDKWRRNHALGQKNRMKTYRFTSPSGELKEILGLNNFCRENGLTLSAMLAVNSGLANVHKGWRAANA